MKDVLTWIDEGIVEIKGEATFNEVNAEMGGYCLPVEPLSAERTISQFIKEGGIGYNSMEKRTFASSIFQLSSSTSSGIKFTYGSKYKTLYNAGYPLHRIIGCPLSSIKIPQKFGQVEKVILPVNKNENVEVIFQTMGLDQLHANDNASNIFFVNEFGAELMGLKGEGIVKTYRFGHAEDKRPEDKVWEKRFLEDLIPADHNALKVLTMKSGLAEIYKIFNENAHGLFFALRVHNGILLLMSGKRGYLDKLSQNIRRIPLTFEIRA
ncbi:hypothetical protein PITCH_A320002 [uncultured Desulfobacterium sp.]|uniref:Uncharacterized protein n=1 Tax=uncultured Desulfobacterium sp. TaxID=201089 RepID=A0A445MZ68_9BACT|nr:hypothetical protein PITCH_A320002 [uncultured Desulfobacterium sp.]